MDRWGRPTDRQRDTDRERHKMKFLRTISNDRGVHQLSFTEHYYIILIFIL